MKVKIYIWKDSYGTEYCVFAKNTKKAREIIIDMYGNKPEVLKMISFRPTIVKIPKVIVCLDPYRTLFRNY